MRHSFTSLSVYKTCPRQYKARYIDRSVQFTAGAEAEWGKQVHTAMEARIQSREYDMPDGMKKYAKPADAVLNWLKGYNIYTEEQLAIDEFFQPTARGTATFFGVIDFLAIRGTHAVIADWKTGKVKQDTEQLQFYTMLTMLNHPMVERVTAMLVWLKHRSTTRADYTRDDLSAFTAKFTERMYQVDTDRTYVPQPSGLCRKWCPVVACEYNGLRNKEAC